MPGYRICGHSDCVNPEHLQSNLNKTISDLEIILLMSDFQGYKKGSVSSGKA